LHVKQKAGLYKTIAEPQPPLFIAPPSARRLISSIPMLFPLLQHWAKTAMIERLLFRRDAEGVRNREMSTVTTPTSFPITASMRCDLVIYPLPPSHPPE
jgi:hypothetical protein